MELALRAIHFLGGILWIGGTVAIAVVAGQIKSSNEEAFKALRGASLKVATGGMLLAWIGGLGVLIPSFTSVYVKQGWMHGKLTLVLIAAALSGVLSAKLRKAAAGETVAPATVQTLGLIIGAIALAVVILATLRPF